MADQNNRVVVNGLNPNLKIQADTQKFDYDAINVVTNFVLKNNFTPVENVKAVSNLIFSFTGPSYIAVTSMNDSLSINKKEDEEDLGTEQIQKVDYPCLSISILPRTERIDESDDKHIQEEQKCVKNAQIGLFGDVDVKYNFIHKVRDPESGKDACNKDYAKKLVKKASKYTKYKEDNNFPSTKSGYPLGGYCISRFDDDTNVIQIIASMRGESYTEKLIPYIVGVFDKTTKALTNEKHTFTVSGLEFSQAKCVVFAMPGTAQIGTLVFANNSQCYLGVKNSPLDDEEEPIWTDLSSLFNNTTILANITYILDVVVLDDQVKILIQKQENFTPTAEWVLIFNENFTSLNIVEVNDPTNYRLLANKDYTLVRTYSDRITSLDGSIVYKDRTGSPNKSIPFLTSNNFLFTGERINDTYRCLEYIDIDNPIDECMVPFWVEDNYEAPLSLVKAVPAPGGGIVALVRSNSSSAKMWLMKTSLDNGTDWHVIRRLSELEDAVQDVYCDDVITVVNTGYHNSTYDGSILWILYNL